MVLKDELKQLLDKTFLRLVESGKLKPAEIPNYKIETPKSDQHGDLATNLAMVLASSQKSPPRNIAQAILDGFEDSGGLVAKAEIAGPGFINFTIADTRWREVIRAVETQGDRFGACGLGRGKKVQVEFVSANPTGPLHVGHGRGAALGDVLANLLQATGHDVQREYYINDAGTQMETLGRSVWLRMKEHAGQTIDYPETCYQGDYIVDMARQLSGERPVSSFSTDEEAIAVCFAYAASHILQGIKDDLEDFGIVFDQWFSEKTLTSENRLEDIFEELAKKDLTYSEDGALWFRSSRFGDEKDRVLVRSSGEVTYFASDIAYHWNKVQRGFEMMVDVWGADHHGYVPRIKAVMEALEPNGSDRLQVILVQLVNLLRGGEPVSMSTRAGTFVTLREVIDEVGSDAARFIFLTRRGDSALDFDLEVAKAQTNDNPVFYVQYAHARICSVLALAKERDIALRPIETVDLNLLAEKEEMQIIKRMNGFPELVQTSAASLETHRLTYYLTELVSDFHRFYKEHRIIGDDPEISQARLHFVVSIRTVIRNGLRLLGVTAPDRM